MKNFIFSLIALLVVNTLAFAQTAVFKAGAFAQDISPEELPISINGNMKDGKATMVHDRIHARCIVLDDGITKLALVVCDSCMIPREVFDAAKNPSQIKLVSLQPTYFALQPIPIQRPPQPGFFKASPRKITLRFLKK